MFQHLNTYNRKMLVFTPRSWFSRLGKVGGSIIGSGRVGVGGVGCRLESRTGSRGFRGSRGSRDSWVSRSSRGSIGSRGSGDSRGSRSSRGSIGSRGTRSFRAFRGFSDSRGPRSVSERTEGSDTDISGSSRPVICGPERV